MTVVLEYLILFENHSNGRNMIQFSIRELLEYLLLIMDFIFF